MGNSNNISLSLGGISTWKHYELRKPPIGELVLAYNPKWVDGELNPKGIRTGFEDDGGFISSHWWSYQDCFVTISHSECDNNPLYSKDTQKSIEPLLWVELDVLTDKIPKKKKK